MFEAGSVDVGEIQWIEEIGGLLLENEIHRSAYHAPAIPVSFPVDEDKVVFGEVLAEFFGLIKQSFIFLELEIGGGYEDIGENDERGDDIEPDFFLAGILKENDGIEYAARNDREGEPSEHPRMVRGYARMEEICHGRKDYQCRNKHFESSLFHEVCGSEKSKDDEFDDGIICKDSPKI